MIIKCYGGPYGILLKFLIKRSGSHVNLSDKVLKKGETHFVLLRILRTPRNINLKS